MGTKFNAPVLSLQTTEERAKVLGRGGRLYGLKPSTQSGYKHVTAEHQWNFTCTGFEGRIHCHPKVAKAVQLDSTIGDWRRPVCDLGIIVALRDWWFVGPPCPRGVRGTCGDASQ